MGRPINKRFIGPLEDAGNQVEVAVVEGVTGILAQKGTGVYDVEDDGSGDPGRIRLSPVTEELAVGKGRIQIRVAGGDTATATSTLKLVNATIDTAGTSYGSGNILSLVGGTSTTTATVNVTSVAEGTGIILGISINNAGVYTVATEIGDQPFSGGTGSGAAFDLTWGVGGIIIVAGGTNYPVAPTVTIASPGAGETAIGTVNLEGTTSVVEGFVTSAGDGYFGATPTVTIAVPPSITEYVRKLNNRSVSTFEGNSYQWMFGAGFSGLAAKGNITGS